MVDGFVSLRTFPDKDGKSKPLNITPVPLDGDIEHLIEPAFRDACLAASNVTKAVFCPPVAVFSNAQHAREEDLLAGPVLSAECDARPRAAKATLEALLGPVKIAVESGGMWTDPETGVVEPKLHLYYRLKVPARGEALKKLKEARRLATTIVGADASNVTIVHPIRWPGSVHRKGDPKLCRIVELNSDVEIDLDIVLGVLQRVSADVHDEPTNPQTKPSKGNGSADIGPTPAVFGGLPLNNLGAGINLHRPLDLEPILEGCAWLKHVHDTGGADQSEVLWRDALRCCIPVAEQEELIHKLSSEHPGYDKDETEKKFEAALRSKEERDLGWPQCKTIAEHGAVQCKTCPHLAKGKSPLNLAITRVVAAEARFAPRDLWAKFDVPRRPTGLLP